MTLPPRSRVTVAGSTYPATNQGNGTWTLADDTITPPLADGVYDVQATATDAVGNVGTDGTTGELTIDIRPRWSRSPRSRPMIRLLP